MKNALNKEVLRISGRVQAIPIIRMDERHTFFMMNRPAYVRGIWLTGLLVKIRKSGTSPLWVQISCSQYWIVKTTWDHRQYTSYASCAAWLPSTDNNTKKWAGHYRSWSIDNGTYLLAARSFDRHSSDSLVPLLANRFRRCSSHFHHVAENWCNPKFS